METFKFTVDSALLNELGERLVESVHIALMELVKNSYDADATNVTISFGGTKEGNPKIEILDTGAGMTLEEVREYWMKIATTNKLRKRFSPIYGRPRTGSKGIGRFCCRRLGSYLELSTVGKSKSGSLQKTEVKFDWTTFEAGTDVTEIECPGYSTTIQKEKTGTKLTIIQRGGNEWTQNRFDFIKRHLAVLAANNGTRRSGFKIDPGFKITLHAPQFKGGEVEDLREEMINAGWGTVTAEIDAKGYAICKLEALGIGKKMFSSPEKFPHLKGVTLKVGIIVEDKEQMRNPKVLSKGTVGEILNEWGGVQVRYNGFRVYPYGADDDWLNIDFDRGNRQTSPNELLTEFAKGLFGANANRSMLALLSGRAYVGNVNIDDRAIGFEMKTNREGFIESESVKELKEFSRFCIDWATIYRQYYLLVKSQEIARESAQRFENISENKVEQERVVAAAVEYIDKEIDYVAKLIAPAQRKGLKQKIAAATDAIRGREEANQKELQHLRLIASTSTLVLIFSHEVKSLLGTLEEGSLSLGRLEKTLPSKEAEKVSELKNRLLNSKERFSDLINMTSLIGSESLEATPDRLALAVRIEEAKKCFGLIISSYDVDVDLKNVPNDLKVGPILKAELYAIFLNVLSNSIKSVIASGGQKAIEISAKRLEKQVVIAIRDTGVGLEEEDFETVFTPFVRDPQATLYSRLAQNINPQDSAIMGTGSGLGLTIVRDIVRLRKGSIQFKKPSGRWKSHLEIILP
jgi:signal transduction histidine kinase